MTRKKSVTESAFDRLAVVISGGWEGTFQPHPKQLNRRNKPRLGLGEAKKSGRRTNTLPHKSTAKLTKIGNIRTDFTAQSATLFLLPLESPDPYIHNLWEPVFHDRKPVGRSREPTRSFSGIRVYSLSSRKDPAEG